MRKYSRLPLLLLSCCFFVASCAGGKKFGCPTGFSNNPDKKERIDVLTVIPFEKTVSTTVLQPITQFTNFKKTSL